MRALPWTSFVSLHLFLFFRRKTRWKAQNAKTQNITRLTFFPFSFLFLAIDPDYEIPSGIAGVPVEKASAVMAQFKRRKIASNIAVPTEDSRVRLRLRELGEPITLFGEGQYERRERLRELLVSQYLAERGDVEGDVDTEMADAETEDMQGEAEEEFYTEGVPELLEARQEIARYSLPRAAARIRFQKLENSIPLRTHVKHRKTIKENLAQIDLFGSQIAADRPVSIVRFAPNGQFAAAGNWAGGIKLITVPNLEEKAILRGHTDRVGGLAWFPGATLPNSTVSEEGVNLVSGGGEGNVNLWSLTEETPIRTLSGHTSRVCRVEFHPSGRYVASASYDTTWRLWDVTTGAELLVQEGHSREVYTVAFNADGSLVVSGGLDSIGRVWDLRTGRNVMLLDAHIQPLYAADWSPDSWHVATGAGDGFIKVWDLRNMRQTANVGAHTGGVTDMRWHQGTDGPLSGVDLRRDDAGQLIPRKGGTFVVSSGFDKKVNIFSADDWTLCGGLSGHAGNVLSVDVDPESRWIISGGHDRTVKLWGRDGEPL